MKKMCCSKYELNQYFNELAEEWVSSKWKYSQDFMILHIFWFSTSVSRRKTSSNFKICI